MLKGKAQPIVVHELLGRSDEADEKQKESCVIFAEAIDAFRNQAWDVAAEKFHKATGISESDGPAHFYLKLCDEYKKTPPPETWDGVIALDEK